MSDDHKHGRRFEPGQQLLTAERIRSESASRREGSADVLADRIEAGVREKLAQDVAEVGAGSELVPRETSEAPRASLRDTVADPDYVAADASRYRLELAHQAGCLELALDAADTASAENSLEKMLMHQLAVAHTLAMRVAGRAAIHSTRAAQDRYGTGGRDFHAVEAARAANASARVMEAFQRGLLTLERLRSGGKQVVTVQHVQVNEGGQAVVSGKITGGGTKGRKRAGGRTRK